MLSDREIASLIWLGISVTCFLLIPHLRRSIGPSAGRVLKTFFVWRIQVVLIAYLLWAALVVWLASAVGFWRLDLLKDTVLIVFGGGLATLFTAYKIDSGSSLLSKTIRETVGLSALAVFFVGLASFSLIAELILQPIIVLIVLLGTYASSQANAKPVSILCTVLTSIYGLVAIIWTITQLFQPETDVTSIVLTFCLSLWLPIALAPFMYVAALMMNLGTIFIHPKAMSRRRLPLKIKVALVTGLRFRLSLTHQFTAQWSNRLKDVKTARQTRKLLKHYRSLSPDQRRLGPDDVAMSIIYEVPRLTLEWHRVRFRPKP
ncbi:MAG: hypothetical protein EPO52_12495 [Herbiconiux sp.]|uniref:hypothetical protein n=1 Tax=Herbiconiux sp. TaxID=1871186 RepID=UPI0012044B7D|nr:hypothetical protein [Herbiconiux sp.]TAJ47312.1 MAG: hypothetical protein EPO52_12495 [Herbiconiux sp.]